MTESKDISVVNLSLDDEEGALCCLWCKQKRDRHRDKHSLRSEYIL